MYGIHVQIHSQMHKNLLDQTIMGLYQNERPTHDIYRPATCNTWEKIPQLTYLTADTNVNLIEVCNLGKNYSSGARFNTVIEVPVT